MAPRSILIRRAFPLPCQLPLRLMSWKLPSELIPDTAASKELHKGNTKLICMQGRGHSHPALYTGKCVLRLGPKMPSASTTVLWNGRGMTTNSVDQRKEEGWGLFPSLDAHTPVTKIIH